MQEIAYRLPGEWEAQSAILITWPHKHSDWISNLGKIEKFYITLSFNICRFQKLLIIVYDEPHHTHVLSLLTKHYVDEKNLIFFIAKTNDTWTRDYGPICLTCHSKVKLLNFAFNGWGNKFPATLDNQVIAALINQEMLRPRKYDKLDFILEGGSIDSDGNGSVLTTLSCLLNPTRNPSLNKAKIEHTLLSTLGIKQVLWLDQGYLAGDDTDGHIDVLARFVDENTIVYIHCTDKKDEHYTSSLAMQKQLASFRNVDDQPYNLIPLPFPKPLYDKDNNRLAASYANFLIMNKAVLVPTYDDAKDQTTLQVLNRCFTDREVIGIPCLPVIQQNGSLHCLTMQLPRDINLRNMINK